MNKEKRKMEKVVKRRKKLVIKKKILVEGQRALRNRFNGKLEENRKTKKWQKIAKKNKYNK